MNPILEGGRSLKSPTFLKADFIASFWTRNQPASLAGRISVRQKRNVPPYHNHISLGTQPQAYRRVTAPVVLSKSFSMAVSFLPVEETLLGWRC